VRTREPINPADGLQPSSISVVHAHPFSQEAMKRACLKYLAFAVKSMKIITYAYYGKHISDLPSPATLAANIE